MAWNGSGTFTGLHNWETDRDGGIKITASRHKAQDDVFITGIQACLAKNGENSATGNINLGSNKIVSLADGTTLTDAATVKQAQNGTLHYAADSGSADAYVIAPSPTVTAYVVGQTFTFKAANANTGASTINVSAIGAKAIKKNVSVALDAGDIAANGIVTVIYDGTNFQLISVNNLISASSANTFTATQTMSGAALNEAKGGDVASATTTDIGAATGNFIDVTGTTTITGLGTVQAGTRRTVQFDGILTLTHNASSLILPSGANITTAAGDTAEFISLGSGNWLCTYYQRASGFLIGYTVLDEDDMTSNSATALATQQSIKAYIDSNSTFIQQVYGEIASTLSFATIIPLDDTIPQNTEGTEIITLSITPTNASNILMIEGLFFGSNSASGNTGVMAFFQDSTADALFASANVTPSGSSVHTHYSLYKMTAGTTSSTTFKIRYGFNSGTGKLNADYTGTRLFGGVGKSWIKITEIGV